MMLSLFTIVIQLFFCFSVSSQTASSNRFKRIDYEYDLVSGKVNKVSYQKDSADQFIHQYSYDSDNRITKVETSSDNVVWDVDAKYFYYAHGPLARTEIGNDKVQGIDYAYTLQGWIKGVNSNTLDKKRDMGQDGKDTSIYDPSNPQLHANFAQDAFGYSLNYFKGDYKAINQVRWNNTTNRFEAVTTGSDLMASRHDLHNGNISSMITTIVKPTITPGDTMQFVPLPQGTAYKYDQLNRLVEMKAWQNLNSINNTWGTGLTYNGMYNNKFSYDANGNILTQLRKNASGTTINDLSYNRYNLAGKTMQNRLYMVDDAIGNTAFTDDIDDQGTFDNSTYNNVRTNNNYGYDEIGNMNRNNQKEIAQIKYTVYGKVKEVIRTSGSSKKNLKFDYDPSGNRIAKHVYNSSNVWEKTEYYVLDAQGNTMSVYKHEATGGTPPISFAQIEKNIYGSSRIGVDKTHKELIGAFASTSLTHVTGNKQYDGVNHLGNVLVSFTDKRLPIDVDNNSVIDGYWPEVVSANDYYPFGVKMKERSFASANNRYQFNNKQYDDETETSDFGARNHDGDLGILATIDPLIKDYPWYSPYQYSGNSPIAFVDLDGLERYYAADGSFIHQYGFSLTRKVVSNQIVSDMMKKNPEAFSNAAFRNKYSKNAKILDGFEFVHSQAINAIKQGASMYLNMAKDATNNDTKKAYLEAYSLLINFANGTGKFQTDYNQFDPFVTLLNKDNRMLKEVVSDFEKHLKDNKLTASSYFSDNDKFTGGYEFSPDHAYAEKGMEGLKESFNEHVDAMTKNPLAFVIGGMSYDVTPIFDKDKNITGYNIKFSNVTGKNSLLLHQATDVDPVSGKTIPLANKKQTFTFKITVEEYNKLKEEKK